MRHLVVPDPHANPDYDNRRFDYLGKFIADSKPDYVICLGDLGCMPSLGAYDRGKRCFEGRRYRKDLAAVHDALERVKSPLVGRKKRLPKMFWLEGNHEERIRRAIEEDAAHLEGVISTDDLLHKEFGWEYVGYDGGAPGCLVLDGVHYAHYVTSGPMGRPVAGVNHARSILTKKGVSVVVGHSHLRDFSTITRMDGVTINGLVAGCYFEHFPGYVAADQNASFWRGVVLLDEVENGDYDMSWVSMKTLKKAYA